MGCVLVEYASLPQISLARVLVSGAEAPDLDLNARKLLRAHERSTAEGLAGAGGASGQLAILHSLIQFSLLMIRPHAKH